MRETNQITQSKGLPDRIRPDAKNGKMSMDICSLTGILKRVPRVHDIFINNLVRAGENGKLLYHQFLPMISILSPIESYMTIYVNTKPFGVRVLKKTIEKTNSYMIKAHCEVEICLVM
jgi:hypothetical protein